MFALVLAANVVTPLWADDYCRIAPPRLLEPFAIAWRDYFEWTGRFFATALTYDALSLVEAWSPIPFDVLNAAVFAFLVDQVLRPAKLAGGGGQQSERRGRAVRGTRTLVAAARDRRGGALEDGLDRVSLASGWHVVGRPAGRCAGG